MSGLLRSGKSMVTPAVPGLLIAAPASGSGKTTVTLGVLRALRQAGMRVAPVKVGPDYIDPAFHCAASGRVCCNLDTWAMRPETLTELLVRHGTEADLVLGEGAMGLFDGAPDGRGSTADLARWTGWPVVLVADVRGQAASAAATVHGFASWDQDVRIAGVIYNRTGGERHDALLRKSSERLGIPVLGCLPRRADLVLPDRHLGLVQAAEHDDLEDFLQRTADFIAECVDLSAVVNSARPAVVRDIRPGCGGIPPLGQSIAVASDRAFAFAYPFLLEIWRRRGAEIRDFSPLADEPPPDDADAIYLPGGYPELYAGHLAGAETFRAGMMRAAANGTVIYGECGGYMTLGQGMTDARGGRHAMLGLLPVETSMAASRLCLGYRDAVLAVDCPLGLKGQRFRGHEFHFASVVSGEGDRPLWRVRDASGRDRGGGGGREGSVFGSFFHLIDAWGDGRP